MRKPTRNDMAAEHRARQQAHHKQRLEEAKLTAEFRTGNIESITGRMQMPGEHIGQAPIGSQESIFGVEESQWLTGGGKPWE